MAIDYFKPNYRNSTHGESAIIAHHITRLRQRLDPDTLVFVSVELNQHIVTPELVRQEIGKNLSDLSGDASVIARIRNSTIMVRQPASTQRARGGSPQDPRTRASGFFTNRDTRLSAFTAVQNAVAQRRITVERNYCTYFVAASAAGAASAAPATTSMASAALATSEADRYLCELITQLGNARVLQLWTLRPKVTRKGIDGHTNDDIMMALFVGLAGAHAEYMHMERFPTRPDIGWRDLWGSSVLV